MNQKKWNTIEINTKTASFALLRVRQLALDQSPPKLSDRHEIKSTHANLELTNRRLTSLTTCKVSLQFMVRYAIIT